MGSVVVTTELSCSLFGHVSWAVFFFFSSRRRHTRCLSDWSSDVCSSDLQLHVIGSRSENVLAGILLGGMPPGGAGDVLTTCSGGIDELLISGTSNHREHEIGRASCRERV